MSDYIPEEVVVQILLKLPPKPLVQFSCVCKLWYALITSSRFISMYARLYKGKNPQIIIRHYSRFHGRELFALCSDCDDHFHNDQSYVNHKLIDCPVKSSDGYLLDFVGSCNGLVCLTDKVSADAHKIVLWNPLLGSSKVLPVKDLCDSIIGIGFDSNNFDYKVVRIGFQSGEIAYAEIFTLSDDSWRSIGAEIAFPSYIIEKSTPVFFNGNLHWVAVYAWRKSVVAFFDVVNEVFGEFGLPDDLAYCKMSIVAHRKSLTLVHYQEFDVQSCCIWVMRKYGVAESWLKLYTICPLNNFEKTLTLKSNGQILIVTSSGEPVLFDPKTRKEHRFQIYGLSSSFTADTYMESLVLWKGFNMILGKASSSNVASHNEP